MASPGSIYRHFSTKFPTPQKGSLRVWWIPQVPGKPFNWPVKDLGQAALLLDALAAYDDFQFGERVKGDYCNTGGLEIHDGDEWCDWESDDCDDFDTWRDKNTTAELDRLSR